MERSVREDSCSFPLQLQLHALCQRGASGKVRSLRRSLLTTETERNSRKARAITVLLIFLSEISRPAEKFSPRQLIRKDADFVPSWETQSGSGIQFGAVTQVVGFRRSVTGKVKTSYPATCNLPPATFRQVDTAVLGLNNPCMPRPEAAHRVKSYSAATGFVYQYYFYEVQKSKRGAAEGTEYVYMVSVDRKHVFPVRIFVSKDALGKYSARTGREFTGTEEYAVAKMRLFQAFDEMEGLSAKTPVFLVDASNLDTLLSQLDLLD